jgi:hypothetical protein
MGFLGEESTLIGDTSMFCCFLFFDDVFVERYLDGKKYRDVEAYNLELLSDGHTDER